MDSLSNRAAALWDEATAGADAPDIRVGARRHHSKAARAGITPVTAFPARHTIHHIGEPAEAISVIMRGHAQLSVPAPNGSERIVALLGPGDLIGFSSTGRYVCTTRSLTPVTARVVAPWNGAMPGLTLSAVQLVQAQIETSFLHCATLATFTPLQRLADLLVLWARRYAPGSVALNAKCPHPFEVRLPLQRGEIANYLAMTRETLSRTLAELRRRDLIDLNEIRTVCVIRIEDFRKLEALCR
ncbi:Crp/Fnr family transcriptional regulator [Bradyrhizobium sp. WD16]|uniref:Crp/Fnr family transcriptional regulator n=1 Tax=Bradyrhizobium sp. WD16 TaxID=1521768 RepID=UPI0020A2A274|nr:Crp/Fnr family transcriptional regulator [Bradyrhizobium sp. WD16]UTD29087.1 hypothetical protein DB459_21470 [Bradyrhizobium sp. WD16]